MMVTFISQCDKKALNRTRRVLDAFANRIGDNVWQTVITQEGLLAVRKLLRKTATKNTAVSCHWIRSRRRSELAWVVGQRSRFDAQGRIPVNSTRVNRVFQDHKADWLYLDLIQALAAFAALLHDWGKANDRFQAKLLKKTKTQSDPLRHEWVSCILLKAFILQNTDNWLERLASGDIDEMKLMDTDLTKLSNEGPLANLPPTAQLLSWLIVTHHRLPSLSKAQAKRGYLDENADSLSVLLKYIQSDWGYQTPDEDLMACLQFKHGLMSRSKLWLKEIKRWASKLLSMRNQVDEVMNNGSCRVILHHARLCLMLGDHFYSSRSKEDSGSWQAPSKLIANTDRDIGREGQPKQYLDQHLVGVFQQAKRNVRMLPKFEVAAPVSENTSALKRPSPKHPIDFSWQDKAVKAINEWRSRLNDKRFGFFAVNMASTGCGKTFANAKIMQALSVDRQSLRYTLALGLRTLTLQTGEEYRQRIFQSEGGEDLAVLIGSQAIADLHQQQSETQNNHEHCSGSESAEKLLSDTESVMTDCELPSEGLATVIGRTKEKQLLYAPVLVCTIDHLMAATETTRGGRYILPSLRLMSSDLVIDEVDDFTDSDLIALARLVHLVGMLGRKVMISSATIPPALAEGFFNAYREGWELYAKTRQASTIVGCAWIDEFTTQTLSNTQRNTTAALESYRNAHAEFIDQRCRKLQKQPEKRRASIIDCERLITSERTADRSSSSALQRDWFEIIANSALELHNHHCAQIEEKDLKVSFGVIRTANIKPCLQLTRYLLSRDWPEDTNVRAMAYHANQVLLMRHEQERHLDQVLKRKGEHPYADAFDNVVIREHINHALSKGKKHLIFILVATPVEEVGRDHDFDWGIIEPSSYRSLVQMAGRIRRHRLTKTTSENIYVLQYNWKAVKHQGAPEKGCFMRPGYESHEQIARKNGPDRALCKTYNMKRLINEAVIAKRLDASPRINDSDKALSGFGLANLEHLITKHWLCRYENRGPDTLQGYLSGNWCYTALPQVLNRFRASETVDIRLFLWVDDEYQNTLWIKKADDGKIVKNQHGEPIDQSKTDYPITFETLSEHEQSNLWLTRDYVRLMQEQAERFQTKISSVSLRFGELRLSIYNSSIRNQYTYIDQLGIFEDKKDKGEEQ